MANGTPNQEGDVSGDKVTWPDGLGEALEMLKPIMLGAYDGAVTARKRMWERRDTVERLRAELAAAEVALVTAEREYEDCGKHMQLVWDDLRQQVMKIPLRAVAGAEAETPAPPLPSRKQA